MKPKFLLAGLLLVLLTRCVGTSAPPAPIAEIPSFLVFPDSVSITTDRIEAETSPTSLKAAVASGGTYSELIALQAEIANETNLINDTVLSAVGGVAVSMTTPVDHYDSAIDPNFTKANPIKIDFGDFDLDRDGLTEGCSGCTCPVGCTADELSGSGGLCPTTLSAGQTVNPVCFRLWLDDGATGSYARFLAGFFTEVPTDSNGDGVIEDAGAGRYRSYLALDSGDLVTDAFLGVVYDHSDSDNPLRKSTDLFLVGITSDATGETETLVSRSHSRIDQEEAFSGASSEDEVKKTLKNDYEVTDISEETLFEFLNSVAQFRDDEDFWIGTIETQVGFAANNQCVDLTTGNAAPPESCEEIGISIEGETVDRAENEDVALPLVDQFPLDPCDSPNLSESTGC